MIAPVNSLLSFFYFYLNILFLQHHEGFLEHTSFASISVVSHSPVIRSKDEIEKDKRDSWFRILWFFRALKEVDKRENKPETRIASLMLAIHFPF